MPECMDLMPFDLLLENAVLQEGTCPTELWDCAYQPYKDTTVCLMTSNMALLRNYHVIIGRRESCWYFLSLEFVLVGSRILLV